MDEIDQLEQARKALPPSWVPGWAEVPATLASGMASSAAGGLAGLGTVGLNALGLSKANPADVLSSIQQDYTYLPRTVEGMAATHAAGKAFEALHAPVARAADMTLGATGSPALATAVDVGPTALGALMGLPNAMGRGAMSAARATVPEIAPSAPGLGRGLASQRGSIGRAELMVDDATLKRALAMQAAGRGSGEIFRNTDVWLDSPSSPTPGGMPLAEIGDYLDNANPRNIAPPVHPTVLTGLQSAMGALNAKYTYAVARQGGATHAQALELVRGQPGANMIDPNTPTSPGLVVSRMNLLQNEMERLTEPKYAGKLGDVIEHPELFGRLPRLADVNFTTEKGGRFSGKYNPEKDLITLNKDYMDRGPLNTGQTLIHEVGHAIQNHYGLPRGANPASARTSLMKAHEQGRVSDSLFERLMQMDSDEVYHRAWGEGLSNAAMNVLSWDNTERRMLPPWERMGPTIFSSISPDQFWTP